ncbi:MAG TPA: BTAD domain-containing putative transcriptional regulator [Gaiellaceae bacterium]|nr:BTAD domain-containing putative transcriptional regulator [Gaiellaceae bacterium]
MQRTLAAFLVIHANEPVSIDELIEALWEGSPPARAEDALRVHVSRLRRVVEPRLAAGRRSSVLVTVERGYVLRVDPAVIDAHRFAAHADAALRALRDEDALQALAEVERALTLWRGPPFADVRYYDFAQAEIRRLKELREELVELRVEAELRLDRHEHVLPELFSLVERHPHRERLWGQLMLALYRADRQADALEAYREARRRLREELGVEPGPGLRQLERQILQHEPALAAGSKVRLPSPLTAFVGREQELAEVLARLAESRLLTLVGAGGVGKTRLAIETARRAADGFPDGVRLVDLAELTSGESVAGAVLAAIGEPRRIPAPELEIVERSLAHRRALLVLDSCEHLIESAAELSGRLLAGCPELRLLVTSRERLAIPGERVYHVPAMSLPPSDDLHALERADAVKLFLARSADTLGDSLDDEDDLRAAAAVVRAVDGIPLAIELAAGRLGTLSLRELAERMAESLPATSGGSRVAVPRHRTLRAAFDWSFELLGERERELFGRLWVFRGGWTLDALEAVAADEGGVHSAIDSLTRLVHTSMVEAARRGSGVRYSLLEPVREYARSLADPRLVEDLSSRHAAFYASLAREYAPKVVAGDVAARATFEAEEANLTSALSWLLERTAVDDAATLATALAEFWGYVGRYGGARHWIERAVAETSTASPAVRASLLIIAAWAAVSHGELGTAARLATEAESPVDASGDELLRASFLNQLGNVHAVRGEMRTAVEAFEASHRAWLGADAGAAHRPLINLAAVRVWMGECEEAARLARAIRAVAEERDDLLIRALSQLLGGAAALYGGAPQRAEAHFREAIPVVAARGIRWHHALGVVWLGEAALAQGDVERADACAREARALLPSPTPWQILVFSLELAGWAALAADDVGRASRHLDEVARVSLRSDIVGGLPRALDIASVVEQRLGAHDRGALFLGAAETARHELGLARTPHQQRAVESVRAELLADLGRERFEAHLAEGAGLPLREAVALALAPETSTGGRRASVGVTER